VPGQRLVAEIDASDDRALVLRGRAPDEAEAVLARGYAWFEPGRPDLVEALHESRRQARARERRRR
jgi:hypothetical protein